MAHPTTNTPASPLGDALRARRSDLRLRQTELAELAGVSERFVRELEHGKATARLDKVQAVLDVLGLTLTVRLRDREHDA